NIYNDMVITILSNNYSGTINEEANKIISSKKNHIGYGLENATEAIKNYNGIFDINYENNVFTIEIILPFGG
ncbi:MAG: GHKL domain-containing protein, partial [Traorella sp.]